LEIEVWQNEARILKTSIYKREAVIGRGAASIPVDVPLKDAAISRRHAILELDENNQFWLTHTGANPTSLNGENLEPQVKTLAPQGSAIEICRFKLNFELFARDEVS
jgi:pSer/pThr/pTyr-binding forkhead associated (FHA) protein